MKKNNFFSIPYILWLLLFVIAPVILILWQSFFDIQEILPWIITRRSLVLGLIFE